MKRTRKRISNGYQDSFFKGLIVGVGATIAISAISGLVVYRVLKLRREKSKDIRFYKFSMEGGIAPDSAVDVITPSFKDASDKIERDYEMHLKEYEEAEEALKNLEENF